MQSVIEHEADCTFWIIDVGRNNQIAGAAMRVETARPRPRPQSDRTAPGHDTDCALEPEGEAADSTESITRALTEGLGQVDVHRCV